MDGVGVAPQNSGNAVMIANTPNLDKLWPQYPHTYLEASGLNVGLPLGTDGNSEVGHMTMGAGKVIFQNLPKIDNSIQNGSFFDNPILKDAFTHAKKNKSQIHLIGLAGNGSVHASTDHLLNLITFAVKEKVDPDKLFIHAFTDGRDSSNTAGIDVLEKIEAYCIQKRMGRIVSVIGRAFAMDRNRNWAKTKIAYDLLTQGKGLRTKNFRKTMEEFYDKKIFDEYIEPFTITLGNEDPITIRDGDSVIFYNYRPDRAVQLDMAFEDENFTGFDREMLKDLYFVGMVDYENGFPKRQAFPQEKVIRPLGKVLSDLGLKQLRIAESEKFPHVTYFFNGQNKEMYPGETWVEVPSPKDVATYDMKPEMSQKWIADVLVEKIKSNEFDFILVNFAGPDMVAHTGNIDATVKAMETCDYCVGKILEAVLEMDGMAFITADHGNAEELIDLRTQKPDTKHSTNPVPFIVVSKNMQPRELTVGGLSDIAPTLLTQMGIEVPADMTGRDLLA
jgi:2,3-bisphosphoglycerate-independent phosphoglycerate mutase